MRKQLTAMALVLTLCASLLATPVAAAETTSTAEDAVTTSGSTEEQAAAEESASTSDSTEEQAAPEEEVIPPDEEGTVSFENLEKRVRENNANMLALEETIASIESLDYDKLYDDLRDTLNNIVKGQEGLYQLAQLPKDNPYYQEFDSYTYAQLDEAYDAVRDTFDDIKDGKFQEDNADLIWQLETVQNQIVMGAESLYIALVDLEIQAGALERQLAALDRTVTEMELRYKLGQISSLQLQQVKSGRTSLASGISTLQMNISVLKMQLEQMLGVEMTGTIKLAALPTIQRSQVEEMELETDLAAAKENSYTIRSAEKTLEQAHEDFLDDAKDYNFNEKNYNYQIVKHTWQAAQHTYAASIQSFELSFRTTYLQVPDFLQALEAAEAALAYEQSNYAATELKYQQGTISKNKLLDAQDTLTTAEEAVQSASIDLFSAYHTYQWAVEHGILN